MYVYICYIKTLLRVVSVMQIKHLVFISCVEGSLGLKQDKDAWVSCCTELQYNPNPVKDCYESGHGHEVSFGIFAVIVVAIMSIFKL